MARLEIIPDRKSGINAVFRELVDSAFEFLERGIDGIESDRKHSIIDFATAIELFLKARLLAEHWTLVVEKIDTAEHRSFLEGNVRTIGTEGAIRRLSRILSISVSEDAAKQFAAIAAQRNKAIHFYHQESSPRASGRDLEKTVLDQVTGWYYLQELLAEWSSQFQGYEKEMLRISYKMQRHTHFLRVKFENLRPKIEGEVAKGEVYDECPSCKFPAARRRRMSDFVSRLRCRVCGVRNFTISFECIGEECGQPINLSSHHPGQRSCKNCGEVYDEGALREILENFSDPTDHHDIINCANCQSLNSGIDHQDLVLCTECLIAQGSAAQCGWCNERQIGGGDLRNSEWSGCEFCEGRAGWDKD